MPTCHELTKDVIVLTFNAAGIVLGRSAVSGETQSHGKAMDQAENAYREKIVASTYRVPFAIRPTWLHADGPGLKLDSDNTRIMQMFHLASGRVSSHPGENGEMRLLRVPSGSWESAK